LDPQEELGRTGLHLDTHVERPLGPPRSSGGRAGWRRQFLGRDPDAQPGAFDLGVETLFTVAYADGSFERVENPHHLTEEALRAEQHKLSAGARALPEPKCVL
jgi:hypothetical protein